MADFDFDDDIFGDVEDDDSDSFSFGNDIDDDDDDDSIEGLDMSDEPIKKPSNSQRIEENKVKDFKKTALMLLGIGLLLLALAFVGIRVVSSVKNSSGSVQTTQGNMNQNSGVSQNVNNNNVITSPQTTSSQTLWQEISVSGLSLGDTWVESTFTITDLRHYGMVSNTNNDKQIKSVVKGNISGLVGTYEMELPTYKAMKLSVGTSFKITYQLQEQNGYKIIGDIQY